MGLLSSLQMSRGSLLTVVMAIVTFINGKGNITLTRVVKRLSFGGGSMMVWGGITTHHRTQLEVIHGNLIGIRCCDEVLQVPVGSCTSHPSSTE